MTTLSNQLAEAVLTESRIPVEGYGSLGVVATKDGEVSVRPQGGYSYEMTPESAIKLAHAIKRGASDKPARVTVKSKDFSYHIQLDRRTGIGNVPALGIQPKLGHGAARYNRWDLNPGVADRFAKALERAATKAAKLAEATRTKKPLAGYGDRMVDSQAVAASERLVPDKTLRANLSMAAIHFAQKQALKHKRAGTNPGSGSNASHWYRELERLPLGLKGLTAPQLKAFATLYDSALRWNMHMTEAVLVESEAYVDDEGYAHDDEGNKWFVGKRYAGGTYKPSQLPMPSGGGKSRAKVDNTKRIEAFVRLPERQVAGSFGKSILSQLKDGRALSDKQKKVVRQMFYRARMRDEADLFR